MAWTAQTPLTSAQVLNAAYLNAYRDNLLSLRNGNDHYCRLYLTTNPSIGNNVATGSAISWSAALFNVGTIWTSGNKLVAPVTGKYLILATLEWRSNVAGLRNVIGMHKNSANTLIRQHDGQSQGSTGGKSSTGGKFCLQMTATDYFEVRAYQDSGAALTLHGGAPDRTRVAVLFLGV